MNSGSLVDLIIEIFLFVCVNNTGTKAKAKAKEEMRCLFKI